MHITRVDLCFSYKLLDIRNIYTQKLYDELVVVSQSVLALVCWAKHRLVNFIATKGRLSEHRVATCSSPYLLVVFWLPDASGPLLDQSCLFRSTQQTQVRSQTEPPPATSSFSVVVQHLFCRRNWCPMQGSTRLPNIRWAREAR